MVKYIMSKVRKFPVVRVPSCHFPLFTFLFVFTFSLLLTSCDEEKIPDIDDILSSVEKEETVGEALQITDIDFSEDYKVMELSARLLHDVGGQDLTDSTLVHATAHQRIKDYLLGLACVAILLMGLNLLKSKLAMVKQARDQAKKLKGLTGGQHNYPTI